MRVDSTLNVKLEGSLCDLPTAVGGMEEARERTQQVPKKRLQGGPSTDVKTSIEVTPESLLKVAPEGNVRESPRRIQRTREASREDAIASPIQFFALVNERNRGTMTEGPIETSPDAFGRNANDVPITSTPVTPTTPIVTEVETTEGETTSPRTFLPNGSPSRPTATATCRLRTWVHHISEGQINEPTQEDTNSVESSLTESYVLAEGIPEELGCEWRVLHPFEIPGVRFPTDNTPPNQRRLAENDALVELIQTTEYLEDTPTWGQRYYWLYPPQYGDPFYRGGGRGRGRGRWQWLSERPLERSNGGFGRGFCHRNGRGTGGNTCQITSERDQQDRQEEEWLLPTSVETREEGISIRQESPHRTPPTPTPSKDRLFTD